MYKCYCSVVKPCISSFVYKRISDGGGWRSSEPGFTAIVCEISLTDNRNIESCFHTYITNCPPPATPLRISLLDVRPYLATEMTKYKPVNKPWINTILDSVSQRLRLSIINILFWDCNQKDSSQDKGKLYHWSQQFIISLVLTTVFHTPKGIFGRVGKK